VTLEPVFAHVVRGVGITVSSLAQLGVVKSWTQGTKSQETGTTYGRKEGAAGSGTTTSPAPPRGRREPAARSPRGKWQDPTTETPDPANGPLHQEAHRRELHAPTVPGAAGLAVGEHDFFL
jgi:hypothetical protein